MIHLSLSLAVTCLLSIWIIEHAAGCGDRQTDINGQCCDLCPPGTHIKEFCSERRKTVCLTCAEGYYLNHYNFFDRCEKCRSCPQEYAENCTVIADAKCSCRSGFLCSNNACSSCEENKCVMGEKLKRTENSLGKGLIEYAYHCEPSCPDTAYFDVKENVCRPRIQCSILGLAERFPGNKTHNALCGRDESHGHAGGFIHVFLGIGFVLISFTLLVSLSYTCIKRLMKPKLNDHPIDKLAVSANTSDFHLSKEESGFQLIIQDETKNSDSLGKLHLEEVDAF
ncbi:tumor necrosis factor receptor superfamily member 18 [Chelmon rostratus]|uniref:tumor necrosis factor receptor superfamily member 18 n=1 Tax=Chelmon rostratus TaxID=109905 RepID=UPI001BEAB0B0|nr:tumor necrosis factor receptor superfamily member 18 [Chelmon rostratus]